MPTIFKLHGLRFVIFVDDHEPAHVHAFGDGEAKIEIGHDGRSPRVIYAVRMTAATLRKACAAVEANQAMLLQRWNEIHDRAD